MVFNYRIDIVLYFLVSDLSCHVGTKIISAVFNCACPSIQQTRRVEIASIHRKTPAKCAEERYSPGVCPGSMLVSINMHKSEWLFSIWTFKRMSVLRDGQA